MEKVTYYRTETEADYWDLAGSLGIRNGKVKIENFLRSMWEKHGNNTCVKVIEHDDGEITWEVELYKSVAMRGQIVIYHRKKGLTDKERELRNYSEQIAKKKEELSNQQRQDNHKLFNEIVTDLEQTYIAKNKDYGNSFEESLDEFGEIAGLVRIGDKFNRAKNLSENKANITDESKIDTYLDMANYCIMQAMWLMKKDNE